MTEEQKKNLEEQDKNVAPEANEISDNELDAVAGGLRPDWRKNNQ